ncbi:MAG TPA: hypothetical protein PLV68_16605, partial [Ilumatobacteraceae bacterium]|nr:hypothetical protein [Ilumatobacteraceae bacterium]
MTADSNGAATPVSTAALGDGATADRTLRIGYAYPDVAAFAVLNDDFSIGDPELQANAVLQAMRRRGELPIGGIDIELVFAKYNILSPSEQLGACTKLAQDDQVFAVIAGRDFKVGSACL